jgi:hypothetical protein
MRELLRLFWLPLVLTVAAFARMPFGLDWVGGLTLLVLGIGAGASIQALHAHLSDPEAGEDPQFPLGDYWIYTLAAGAVGCILIDAAILATPLAGALAGRFGYLAYG